MILTRQIIITRVPRLASQKQAAKAGWFIRHSTASDVTCHETAPNSPEIGLAGQALKKTNNPHIGRGAKPDASAANRTRGPSMATMDFTTKPLTL